MAFVEVAPHNKKDKKKYDRNPRLELFVAAADDLVAHASGKLGDHFRNVLRGTGLIGRQREPYHYEERDQSQGHQQFHGKCIVDRRRWVRRVNAKRLQCRGDDPAEKVIQQAGNCIRFRHENVTF